MATAARSIKVLPNPDAGSVLYTKNTDNKVIFGNASANDITQLGTNKVLLVVDADATTAEGKRLILNAAENAVGELRIRLGLATSPATMGTSTVNSYRGQGVGC